MHSGVIVFTFVLTVIAALALIARVHATAYPHIDDVLRELDEEDRKARERIASRMEKNVAN